jgi:hypothetical protein
LEVRRYGDGHPPVTKREREIRLNGISGVTFQKPGSRFRSGFFVCAFNVLTDLKMAREDRQCAVTCAHC